VCLREEEGVKFLGNPPTFLGPGGRPGLGEGSISDEGRRAELLTPKGKKERRNVRRRRSVSPERTEKTRKKKERTEEKAYYVGCRKGSYASRGERGGPETHHKREA